MAKGRNRKTEYNYVPPKRQVCDVCGQNLLLDKFYKTNNEAFQGMENTFPICKDCISKQIKQDDGSYDLRELDNILRKMNRPFDGRVWEKSLIEGKQRNYSPLGIYFRMVAHYVCGYSVGDLALYLKNKEEKERTTPEIEESKDPEDFDLAQAQELFGSGLTMREYQLMDKKYKTLIQSYSVKTAMHKEFLITYVRYKVKEEIAITDGDIALAEKCSNMATKAADNAKLTPKQLTTADLQGGLTSFSEIFEAVEGATDIIEILPKFKQQPHDMADFILWNYINYERELSGMPRVSYADVYRFYDERKEEYLREHGDPFGIFARDNTQDPVQRKTIEKFITVPKDGDG